MQPTACIGVGGFDVIVVIFMMIKHQRFRQHLFLVTASNCCSFISKVCRSFVLQFTVHISHMLIGNDHPLYSVVTPSIDG